MTASGTGRVATGRAVPSRRAGFVVLVLACCGVLVSLMHTLLMPVLGILPALLETTPSNVTWLVTITLLAGAVSAPVLGRLGDMYGKRRMLLLAIGLITVGSLVGAITESFAAVMIARGLQGAAMGVVPLGISIMRDVLPDDRVPAGTAMMSTTMGLGGAVGLPTAGLLAQHADWHVLFLAPAIAGAVEFLLVWKFVPESRVRAGGRFDVVGAIGLSIALALVLLVISKGGIWGWTSSITVGMLIGFATIIPFWGYHQLRVRSPLVDLRISVSRAVLLTNIASVLTGFGMFANFLLTAQMLQAPRQTGYGMDMSIVMSGLVMLPSGLAMAISAPLGARLSRRTDPKVTLIAGSLVLAVGNLGRCLAHESLALVIVAITVASIGGAMAFAAMPLLIMRAVPSSETAAANSLNMLMRSIGTSSCSAMISAFVAIFTIDVGGRIFGSQTAYTLAFVVGAVGAAVAAVLVVFVPKPRSAVDQPTQQPTQQPTRENGPAWRSGSIGAWTAPEGHAQVRAGQSVLVVLDEDGKKVAWTRVGTTGEPFHVLPYADGLRLQVASSSPRAPLTELVKAASAHCPGIRVPLAGASVRLLDDAGNVVAFSRSADDGSYLLDSRHVASG